MTSIQERLLSAAPQLDASSPRKLWHQILKILRDAKGKGQLRPRGELEKLVVLDPPEPDAAHEYVIVGGGAKDMKRRPGNARLIRRDRAWIHFTMTLRQHPGASIEMLAYDFELVFPAGHRPGWIRFDLNYPGHPNDEREIRSHIHPGNADILLPAPVMTPTEILHMMLYDLAPRGTRAPRMPTDDMPSGRRTRLLWSFRRGAEAAREAAKGTPC